VEVIDWMTKYVIIEVTVKEDDEDDFLDFVDASTFWHETETGRRFEVDD
jgi:hypothetical protein